MDEDSLMDANASEEMKKSQLAAREATKNLTAAPAAASGAQAKPNMNIKVSLLFCMFFCCFAPRTLLLTVEVAVQWSFTGQGWRRSEEERTAVVVTCRSL